MAFIGDIVPTARAYRKAYGCKWCGKIFWDLPSHERVTCSKECTYALRSWRNNATKFCKTCGNAFSGPRSRMKKQDYCSLDCAPAGRPPKKEMRTCVGCGEEFETTPCTTKKYCTHECYIEHRRGTGQKEFTCEHCGKKFVDRRTVDRRYCSRECNGAALSEAKTEMRECAICGEEFAANLSSEQYYCSKNCSNFARNGNSKALPADNTKKGRQRREAYSVLESEGIEVPVGHYVHHIDMDRDNNTVENFHIFESNSAHHLSHGSLNKCVKPLMDLDFLRFDKETGEYYVPI